MTPRVRSQKPFSGHISPFWATPTRRSGIFFGSECISRIKSIARFIAGLFRKPVSRDGYTRSFNMEHDFPQRKKRHGKDRTNRWMNRPALCKWQNIPTRSVNTKFNAKWHQAMRDLEETKVAAA